MDNLEKIWSDILSQEPGLIIATYQSLDEESQKVVTSHLQVMISEPGWSSGQKNSARIALDAIQSSKQDGIH